MKNKISFLAVLAIALNVNYVCASECIDEDCDLEQIETEEYIESIDVLAPVKYTVNWTEESETPETCEYDYNCPFDNPHDCSIWNKKPLFKTAVTPRGPRINPVRVEDMMYAVYSNPKISANDSAMKPLTERYTMLMNASSACCMSGILYKMRQNGADDKAIYEFLKDDANYFAITKRCLVMADEDITQRYSYGVTGAMLADVRNACLCKNRQWFDTLLQPFTDMYNRAPEFKSADFTYKYIDGMNRTISVSVNKDVQNTIGMLAVCPK